MSAQVSIGDPVIVTYYYSVSVSGQTTKEETGTVMAVYNGLIVVSMDQDSTIQFFPENHVRLKD